MKFKGLATVALVGAVAFGIGANLDSYAGFTKTLKDETPWTEKKISTNPFVIEDFAGILSQDFEVKEFAPGQQIVHQFTPQNKSGLHVKYDLNVKGAGTLFNDAGQGVPLVMKIQKQNADGWVTLAEGKANELNVNDDIPNGNPKATNDAWGQTQNYRIVLDWPDNGEYDNNYKGVTGNIAIEVKAKQNLGAEKVFFTDMNVNGLGNQGIPQSSQVLQQKVTFTKDQDGVKTAKVHVVGGDVNQEFVIPHDKIKVPANTSGNVVLRFEVSSTVAYEFHFMPTQEMLDFIR